MSAQHTPTPWVVTYTYDAPGPAGPFKGRMQSEKPLKRGDSIRAPFGCATVKSCRAARAKAGAA